MGWKDRAEIEPSLDSCWGNEVSGDIAVPEGETH